MKLNHNPMALDEKIDLMGVKIQSIEFSKNIEFTVSSGSHQIGSSMQ
jgi:hypothetical protein